MRRKLCLYNQSFIFGDVCLNAAKIQVAAIAQQAPQDRRVGAMHMVNFKGCLLAFLATHLTASILLLVSDVDPFDANAIFRFEIRLSLRRGAAFLALTGHSVRLCPVNCEKVDALFLQTL
jgi:hypothetical protein